MKNITEGNKLIAEFMGAWLTDYTDRSGITSKNWMSKDNLLSGNQSLKGNGIDELFFHISWDWLKPVIDRIIETIGVRTIDECSDEEWIQATRIARMYIGIDIKEAHHYVVEWIKWYNENKK